jgi:pimeloyl-ACP methyl ester carboxylesterase
VIQKSLTSVDGIDLDAAIHPREAETDHGTVIYAHGISADLDEFGPPVRLADHLARVGFTVVRFSFRGHGRSGGTARGMTIAGEMLDLQAVVDYARRELPTPISLVASSFGAVSATLSLPWMNDLLDRLVLWRPLLDLRRTILEPETVWGRQNFSAQARRHLFEEGFLVLNGTFEVGRVLFEEFRHYDPRGAFAASTVPTLIVHGDQDSITSYEIARAAAASRPASDFHTVVGADHGFDVAEHEREAIEATMAWLTGGE